MNVCPEERDGNSYCIGAIVFAFYSVVAFKLVLSWMFRLLLSTTEPLRW